MRRLNDFLIFGAAIAGAVWLGLWLERNYPNP